MNRHFASTFLTLLALAALVGWRPQVVRSAPRPPADPAIAFTAGAVIRDELRVMNADGTNQSTIFDDNNWAAFPSWSPDGRQIVFEHAANDLWLIDVAVVNGVPRGSNPRLLLDCGVQQCSDPAWSPTGSEIAFSPGAHSISVVPAVGGPVELIYPAPPDTTVGSPTWSRDGSRIAFKENVVGGRLVKIVDRATGVVTHTFTPGPFNGIDSLDWARRSDTLAFTARSGLDSSVQLLDIATGAVTPVIAGGYPSWSPDDSQLVFKGTDLKIKTISLATGVVRTLVKSGGSEPEWRRF